MPTKPRAEAKGKSAQPQPPRRPASRKPLKLMDFTRQRLLQNEIGRALVMMTAGLRWSRLLTG
ncbi:MAG TPA: hypothetical protein DCM70_01195 [Rhodobacteraceae bacterium]|nr:hypothetical protein [Paracoccaceae bacterium]